MKMAEIKQEVYKLTSTKTTKELKREHPELTRGHDLRYKAHWLMILERLRALKQIPDISLADLEQSEQMLKASLFKVGSMAGLNDDELELDWQRIQLEAQIADIHIEELQL
ncbi:MAG: hypothetical protein MJA27_04460 [Pseudanabaenales cyanobacterium]|nr:hypothetical protein [Pseudanabaenales cyanobacterium]